MRPATEALKLSQMVIQGTWSDIPLYQLPHFTQEEVDACREKRLGGIDKPEDLIRLDSKSFLRVADELEFNSQQIADIAEVEKRVFSVVPRVSYKLSPLNNLDPTDPNLYCNSLATLEVRISARYDPSFEQTARDVENPSEELLESLKSGSRSKKAPAIRFRTAAVGGGGGGKSNNAKNTVSEEKNEEGNEEKKEEGTPLTQYVHAPYLCEHRLERWWLLFGEANKGILVGVERTELPDVIDDVNNNVIVKKITFQTPPEPKTWQFSLSLICESYFGRDVQVKVPVNVKKLDESVLQNMRAPGDDDDDDDDDDVDLDLSDDDESDKEEEDEDESDEESESDDDDDDDEEEGMVDDEEEEEEEKKKTNKKNNNNNKRKQKK